MSSNNNTDAADPHTPSAGMANPPGAGFEHGHTPTEKTVHDSVMVDATVASRGGGPGGEGQHSAPAAPEAPPGLPKPAVPHEHRFFVHPFLNIVVCNCGIGKEFGDHFSSAGTDGDMTAVEARAAILSASHVAAPAAQANTATSDSRDAYQLRSDNKRLRTERQVARDEVASARRRISTLEEQVEGLRKRYEEAKREVEDLEDVRDHLRVDASLMAYECEARRAAEEALADAAARRVVPPPTVRGHITGREYDTMKPVLAPCLDDFLKAKIRMDYDEALDDFHNGEDVSAAGESAGSIRRRDDVEAEEARSFLSRSPSREPAHKRARADEPPRAGPSNAPARAPTPTVPRAGRGGDFGRGGRRGGRPRGRGGARNFRLGPFGAPNEPFSPFRPANWTGGTDGWATTTHGPGVFPPGHEPTFTPLQEDDDESDLGSGEPDSDSERIRDRRQLRRKRALELRAEPLRPVAVAISEPAGLQYVRERQVMLMMDMTRVPEVISRIGALTAATAPLGRTRKVDRTPSQLIIQKFNALPRTVADPRHDRPLMPTRDAPLGVWITTLATNVNALPRGIRTMRWGTHNADPHFLAVSQVRTWCTLQRMLPDNTTDFQYRWLTEAILLIGELATTGPGNGRVGYIAWCESFGVELRLNRALSRFTPNHGPLDMPHFVKFLASECGINPIEFNDMLPFVAEACYVNLQLADEVDRSRAVLDSIASHVLQDGGRWPQGLPGPSYWAASSQESKWFYAAPPLPGSDQVLLGHRSPPARIDAIADPNFIYAPNDPEQYRMRKLPVIAVERWVMANVPPAAHPTASGDTVERDEEMEDASKETPSQPETVAAAPIDNPSALSAEGSAQPESVVDADVPKDDLAQHLPTQGEGAGSGAADA